MRTEPPTANSKDNSSIVLFGRSNDVHRQGDSVFSAVNNILSSLVIRTLNIYRQTEQDSQHGDLLNPVTFHFWTARGFDVLLKFARNKPCKKRKPSDGSACPSLGQEELSIKNSLRVGGRY